MKPRLILIAAVGGTFLACGNCARAQGGLFDDLLGGKAKVSSKEQGRSAPQAGKAKSSKSGSSSAQKGNSQEQKAREEAERKRAALAAKAREDAKKEAELAAQKKQLEREKSMAEAARKKADEEKARLRAQIEKEKERLRALEELRSKREAEEKARLMAEKLRAEEMKRRESEAARQADLRARQIAESRRMAEEEARRVAEERRRQQERIDAELVARAQGRQISRGFFGRRAPELPAALEVGPSTQVVDSPPNRYVYINQREISNLNPSNSRIEIDLRAQRARVYNGSDLVIETQISSGKNGHSTPVGNYSVQEMSIDKKSDRYGTWYSASGVKLRGDDRFNPPPGASRFEGADMPYWLRITGGIGMHIGYVPDGPASHGCIRVPSNVQPLIFSKVRVGTPVRITG